MMDSSSRLSNSNSETAWLKKFSKQASRANDFRLTQTAKSFGEERTKGPTQEQDLETETQNTNGSDRNGKKKLDLNEKKERLVSINKQLMRLESHLKQVGVTPGWRAPGWRQYGYSGIDKSTQQLLAEIKGQGKDVETFMELIGPYRDSTDKELEEAYNISIKSKKGKISEYTDDEYNKMKKDYNNMKSLKWIRKRITELGIKDKIRPLLQIQGEIDMRKKAEKDIIDLKDLKNHIETIRKNLNACLEKETEESEDSKKDVLGRFEIMERIRWQASIIMSSIGSEHRRVSAQFGKMEWKINKKIEKRQRVLDSINQRLGKKNSGASETGSGSIENARRNQEEYSPARKKSLYSGSHGASSQMEASSLTRIPTGIESKELSENNGYKSNGM